MLTGMVCKNDVKLVNKSNTEMKMLDKLNTKKSSYFNIHLYGDKFKDARLKRNLDTSGTIKIDIYKPNYINILLMKTKD
jgi:hypothetical protein